MKKGLFINNTRAKDSIYESGCMVYNCLKLSDQYQLDYSEVDINHREITRGYDFYFFNYHDVTMDWLDTRLLKKDLGTVITMILEVLPGDPFVRCPEKHFSFYCVLDPTIVSSKNVYSFPRPLENINFEFAVKPNKTPVIGSFGFATKGKGFEHVVEAVNREFDNAVVKINIPYGDFVPHSKEYASYLADRCRRLAKKGIDVIVTHNFMEKEELIKWCAANDLNCFLYDRNMPGLAATTDQAIVTGRPLAVSDNETFRHITAYLKPYPQSTLKESIANSAVSVKKMKSDWSSENFMKRFERIIAENNLPTRDLTYTAIYNLPLYKKRTSDILKSRIKKYKRKIRKIFFLN